MPQEVVDHRQAQIDRETERFRHYVWNEVHRNLRRLWRQSNEYKELKAALQSAEARYCKAAIRDYDGRHRELYRELVELPHYDVDGYEWNLRNGFTDVSWEEWEQRLNKIKRRERLLDLTVKNPFLYFYGIWLYFVGADLLAGNTKSLEMFFALHAGFAIWMVVFSPIIYWIYRSRKRSRTEVREAEILCFKLKEELYLRTDEAIFGKLQRFDEFFWRLAERMNYRYPRNWRFSEEFFD